MNKLNLLKQAQNLYEIENFNADKIAERLGISRRTVFVLDYSGGRGSNVPLHLTGWVHYRSHGALPKIRNWVKKYKWNENKVRIKDFANQFSPELYSIGSKLLQKTNDDLDNGRELNKHSINAIEEIVKIISKNEKEEFIKAKNNLNVQSINTDGIPPELIQRINKEFLGWNGTY